MNTQPPHVETRLSALGLVLPSPPQPVARYVPAVQSGDLLFLSGVLPFVDGKLAFVGKVGATLTLEAGREAARIALLNTLAVIKATCGTLDAVSQIVRMGVHVACTAEFTRHSAVADGASELLSELFGVGHARLALGAVSLPLDSPVELELIVRVSSAG
jgi:enamine deaminase RidA (YjgF/YER057c/UK114 family)